MRLGQEVRCSPHKLAVALDVDQPKTVDHHLRDSLVIEEGLDWAVAEHVVQEFGRELLTLAVGNPGVLFEEPTTELGDDLVLDLLLSK